MRRELARRRTPGAFTLIEVMIAVLVLALGLLGLGAVFPVVVRAQRISNEDTLGTAAVNSARAYLRSYDFRTAMTPWTAPGIDNRRFWRDWRDDPINGLNHPSPGAGSPSADELAYWVVPPTDNDTNDTLLGVPANNAAGRPVSSEVTLPVRERLVPLGVAGDPPPQFVWDIAVHRASDFDWRTDATTDILEVAVFVRRLDLRIRPEPGYTLYQVLTGERGGGVADALRKRPVGVHETGVQAELPSGDGTGKYAVPITVDVEFRYDPASGVNERDRLYLLSGGSNAEWQMVRQSGQKLVDNLGQIHTVRTWAEDGSDRYVVLEAPVKTQASSRLTLQQVVLTPTVPASVFIVKVRP